MLCRLILLSCVLFGLNSAACVDGTTNRVEVVDIADSTLDVHLYNGVGNTYDQNGVPSCYNNEASLDFPGQLKLVNGLLNVTAANNVSGEGIILLTLKKNSLLIGTLCQNGKSKSALVPDADCQVPALFLGPAFCSLISTPGSYDLATIEEDLGLGSGTIVFTPLPDALTPIIKGEWQIQLNIQIEGRTIANLQIPSNSKYVYVN